MNIKEELIKEVNKIKIIDTHAHPFNPYLKKLELEHLIQLLAIGGPEYEKFYENKVKELKELILYKFLIKELAKLFNVEKDEKVVINKRNEYAENFKNYVEMLLNNAGIKGFIIDDGYSEAKGEHALPYININEFSNVIPNVIVKYVHRIEPDIKISFENNDTFDSFIDDIENKIKNYILDQKYAGFKSIIAYRTGLDINFRSEEEAKKEFINYKEGKGEKEWFGYKLKVVREYIISLIIEKISNTTKALQIHVGIGDKDIVLEKSFPHNLFNFLKNEKTRKAKIVLVHGGYPNIAIASYLANAFPNVYMDISIATPFGLVNLDNRIKEAMELSPVSKIMYASDGYYIPEIHWISAIAFRRSLIRNLEILVKNEIIDINEAIKIAEMILYLNAEKVYNLS